MKRTAPLPAPGAPRRSPAAGFTLVELLMAAAILSLLVALLLNMVTQTSRNLEGDER